MASIERFEQLYIAEDRNYVDKSTFDEIAKLLIETSRTISGFMKYLQSAPERGSKFK